MILSHIYKLKVLIILQFTTGNTIGTLSLPYCTVVIHNIKRIPFFVFSLYDQGTLDCPLVIYPIYWCNGFMVEDIASNLKFITKVIREKRVDNRCVPLRPF